MFGASSLSVYDFGVSSHKSIENEMIKNIGHENPSKMELSKFQDLSCI